MEKIEGQKKQIDLKCAKGEEGIDNDFESGNQENYAALAGIDKAQSWDACEERRRLLNDFMAKIWQS